MTNTTTTTNEPVARVQDGLLQLAIWKNEGEDGRAFYSASAVERSCKDQAGEYRQTSSLSGSQLLQAARLYALAYDQVRELQDADYQAGKAS